MNITNLELELTWALAFRSSPATAGFTLSVQGWGFAARGQVSGEKYPLPLDSAVVGSATENQRGILHVYPTPERGYTWFGIHALCSVSRMPFICMYIHILSSSHYSTLKLVL